MSMSVETAVVSRRGAAKDFNTDSVNVSGKLWPNDVVHGEKGVRAAGTGTDRPYYVLASSDKKGTAESAASLFQSCVEKFSEDGANDAVLIADYLKAFSKVLNETGFSSSDCDFSILTGVDDTVYIATAGINKAYTFYDDTFIEIVPQQIGYADEKSSFGVAQCSNVKAGDIFILLPGKMVSALPAGLLEAVCKNAAGDVKKIVSLIASQAAKYGCKEAISAIVVKITHALPAAPKAAAEVPAAAAVAAAADDEVKEEAADKTEMTSEEQSEEGEEDAPVSKGKKAGRLFLILLAACAVIAGVLFGIKYWSESHGDPSDSTVDPSSVSASVSASESQNAAAQTSTTQKPSETSTTEVSTTAESTTESTTATTTERATATTRSYSDDDGDEEEEPATVPTTEEEPSEDTTAEEPTTPTSSQEPVTDDDTTENQGGEEGGDEGGNDED